MPDPVTLKDIAQEAGVSVALVSFVMNNRLDADGKPKYRVGAQTRERILETARRLGYRQADPAQSAAPHKRVVGVILPDPADAYYGSLSAELERMALPQGCTLLFGYSRWDPVRFQRLCDVFRGLHADGMVVAPPEGGKEGMDMLWRSSMPYVVPDTGRDPQVSARECAVKLFELMKNNHRYDSTEI